MSPAISRRSVLAAGLGLPMAALAGCTGSSLGSSSSTKQSLTIGFLTAKTGVYKVVGDDLTKGFLLYVKRNGNKLGGHPVNVVVVDHSDKTSTARTAAKKLIQQNNVVAAAGVVDSNTMSAVQGLFTSAHIPLIGCNAASGDTSQNYLWRSSYYNTDPAEAIGAYVAKNAGGPVYILVPDYAAGRDVDSGFRKSFQAAGGKIANPDGKTTYTPFPDTTDFTTYIQDIMNSGAKAVWTFYAGAEAVSFVKQADQLGLTGQMKIYAPGWMTDGSVLTSQGSAAQGIYTVDNYAADLDNAANRTFVSAYREAYKQVPSPYAMQAWDGAMVLDLALARISGTVTGEEIDNKIQQLGQIDSPRGTWSFTDFHTPGQKWYLRRVEKDGRALDNVTIQTLGYLAKA